MQFKSIVAALLTIALAWLTPNATAQAQPITIRVDASKTYPRGVLQQGFLHGLSNLNYDQTLLDIKKIVALKPSFWRIGFDHNFYNNYLLAKAANPQVRITLSLSDLLAIKKGGYRSLKPWQDWSSYEADVREIIQVLQAHHVQIDYWDIWSEPDTAAMWSGSCAQAMEMFLRTAKIISEILPHSKLVGPSVSVFENKGACSQPFIMTFIQYTSAQQVLFDALSWHELDTPHSLIPNAQKVRDTYQTLNLPRPELHINEYGGVADYTLPGWSLAWLSSLEQAQVDWSTLACWDSYCSSGLNGLLQKDGKTPMPVYWVRQAYAQLPETRLAVNLSDKNVATIAAQDAQTGKISLLIGRFESKVAGSNTQDIHVYLENLAPRQRRVQITMQKISPPSYWRLSNQGLAPKQKNTQQVEGGQLNLNLAQVRDGDVWLIEVNPAD